MFYIILQIIEVRDYIFTRGCIHGFGEWLGQHDELIVIAALSTMVMQVSIYRGSYMSAHVLLNLLNELGKRDKMRGLPSILSQFRNEFSKFNNTRA